MAKKQKDIDKVIHKDSSKRGHDDAYDITEQRDAFYSIEDEEENDDVDDGVEDAASEDSSENHHSPLAMLFKVMASPVDGWKTLKRSNISADDYAKNTVYPLAGAAALAEMTTIFYEKLPLSQALEHAVVIFVSIFASYFLFHILGLLLLPVKKSKNFNKEFWKKFSATVIGSLGVLYVIYALAHPIQTALVFLPVYTFYLIYKGVRFLRLQAKEESIEVFVLCALAIGIPLCFYYIFVMIMPDMAVPVAMASE